MASYAKHHFLGRLLLAAAISWAGSPTTAADQPDVPPPTTEASKPADAAPEGDAADDLADLDLEELMKVPVVVTASRREEPLTAVAYAVSVITSQDIRAAGARSVPDALRLAAGVDVAELTYGNAAVSIRGFHGFTSRNVLVLVDGRQIFDALFGGTVWGSWPFQLEDIERIEIIRGPAGVTWGANAVNGVINIITKDPRDQEGFTATVGGASRGSHKEHLGYAWLDGKLRLRLSGEFEGSDGFPVGISRLLSLDDDYKIGRFGLHGVFEQSPKEKLTFSVGSGILDGGIPRSPLGGIGVSRNPGSQASFLLGSWERRTPEDDSYRLTGYLNDFYGSPGLKQIDYRYQQLALLFSHTRQANDRHTLTWGLNGRVDLLDATNSDPQLLSRPSVETATLGIDIKDRWRLRPGWSLDLGGSIQYEFYGGFQPSAEAALQYEVSKTAQLFSSVSRAFQMPPAALRFIEFPLLNGLVWTTADREVDPTTLIAYQLGWRWQPNHRLHTSLAAFWHDFDDYTPLTPQLGPPGLVQLSVANGARADIYGLEWEARYAVTDKFTLLSNYTFQYLTWDSSLPYRQMDYIYPPKHKAMIGAVYRPNTDWCLSTYLYYVDAVTAPNADFPLVGRNIDAYVRWDLRAEREFRDHHASLAFGVRNLTDDNHPEGGTLFINSGEVPRMVYVECRLRIP